jgi:hypothetical protein
MCFYIGTEVFASYREKRWKTQLWLRPSGLLAYSTCNCEGGEHGCHHALTVLARLEHAARMPGPQNLAACAIKHLLSLDEPREEDQRFVLNFHQLSGMDLSSALEPVSTERPRFKPIPGDGNTKLHLPASHLRFDSSAALLKDGFAGALSGQSLSFLLLLISLRRSLRWPCCRDLRP